MHSAPTTDISRETYDAQVVDLRLRGPHALLWLPPLLAGLLAAAGSLAAWRFAGPDQGAAFGACVVGLLAGATACADRRGLLAAATGGAVAFGSAAGPAAAWLSGGASPQVAAAGAGLAAALALAAGGLAALHAAVRVPGSVASLLVAVVGLLWLGWPVWASPYLAGREAWVTPLSAAHPLLAADAAVTRDGGVTWTERRLMYSRLTVLQQHVMAAPPTGVRLAVGVHAGVGATGLAGAVLISIASARRPARITPGLPR